MKEEIIKLYNIWEFISASLGSFYTGFAFEGFFYNKKLFTSSYVSLSDFFNT